MSAGARAPLRAWFERERGDGAWYAVLDAARSERVLPVLRASGGRFESLYEGWKAQELAEVAPYLVALPAATPLWDALLREGWGDAWGVFLHGALPFEDLRRHLRRFLRVRAEDGRRMLFRWYDPRVLRVYLPTCTDEERRAFHGPVRAFVTEDDAARAALRFAPGRAAPDVIAPDAP